MENYDTIFAISCISCGGCIQDFASEREYSSNTIFLFDDSCKSPFIKYIKHLKHISVPQTSLDTLFNDFGNIMLIVKQNEDYILIEKGNVE